MSQPKTFGALVIEKREALGWTQEQLADAAGISVHVIRAIEQGKRKNNTQETICKIATVLRFTHLEVGLAVCPTLPLAA